MCVRACLRVRVYVRERERESVCVYVRVYIDIVNITFIVYIISDSAI